jgi:hypothetical protein
MKIELKLTSDQIFAAANLLEQVNRISTPSTTQDKINKSISLDLSDKFTSKNKSLQKSNSLFDFKKKYKMALKYHEANTLFEVVNQFLPSVGFTNTKAANDLRMLINNLHPKLI